MRNAVYAPNFGEFGCLDKLVNLAVLAEKSGFDGFFSLGSYQYYW